MNKLIISPSPHQHAHISTKMIMLLVIISLLPAAAASAVFFGPRAIALILVCCASSVFFEAVCRIIMKREQTIGDLSALLTGLLLALNLPVTIPYWIAMTGCFVAVVIVKQLFGGLGQNFANPAITARIVLMLSFTSQMTTWAAPMYYNASDKFALFSTSKVVTGATPLVSGTASVKDLFLGNTGGCLGETSAIAILAGGLFLIFTRVISPSTPVAFIGSFALLTFISGGDPLYQTLSGGLLLGAFFMATDYVTTPVTIGGKIIFGTGCGIITFVIRRFGGYPEGVSFSILLMNILTPYIDMATRTKPVGAVYPESIWSKIWRKGRPTIIVTSICMIISVLLLVTFNATYVDTTGMITDSLKTGLKELYGDGQYEMIKNTDGSVLTYDGITSVIENERGQVAFEVTASGYAKDGIHVLVGVSDNGVDGISFIELGETPGVGSKIKEDSEFMGQFMGIKSDSYSFTAITGATYSSKGLKKAVDTAVSAYFNHKGDFKNE